MKQLSKITKIGVLSFYEMKTVRGGKSRPPKSGTVTQITG